MSIAQNGVNNTVIKPQIYLIGIKEKGNSYSQQVDNDIHTYASSGLTYGAKTQFDEDNILSFNEQVRIIITGQMTPKPNYVRNDGEGSISEDNLNFQGNITYDPNIKSVNYFAETWFTFNEKEPIRTSAQFYNFTDMDDRVIVYNNDNPDPSDPSFVKRSEGSEVISDNLLTLGFLLKLSPTGSSLITLKARTYFRGEVSRTAIVVFKLVYPTINTNKIYQNTWVSS